MPFQDGKAVTTFIERKVPHLTIGDGGMELMSWRDDICVCPTAPHFVMTTWRWAGVRRVLFWGVGFGTTMPETVAPFGAVAPGSRLPFDSRRLDISLVWTPVCGSRDDDTIKDASSCFSLCPANGIDGSDFFHYQTLLELWYKSASGRTLSTIWHHSQPRRRKLSALCSIFAASRWIAGSE